MKKHLLLMAGVLAISFTMASAAHAGNSSVEAALQSYGDTSMFYQGLLNTGVINQLQENQHYTIFAPTNAAFARMISRESYPCFYATQCRPQIAALLRSHIIVGDYGLKNLTTYGAGIQASNGYVLHVQEPYVGQYAVDGHTVLSTTEVGGNTIYRINGVIATPQDLSPFSTVNYTPSANSVTTEKTVIRKTYRSPSDTYPSGEMNTAPGMVPDDASQTTTVIRTYETQEP